MKRAHIYSDISLPSSRAKRGDPVGCSQCSGLLRQPFGFLAMTMLLLLFTASIARADCTNPAATAGKGIYNADFNVLQYCDGTDWLSMDARPAVEDITSGLVGHWKFDESAGTTAADSSVNGYDGTLAAGAKIPTWSPTGGKVDGALSFPTTTGADVPRNVSVGNPTPANLRINGDMTMGGWVKTPANSNAMSIFGQDNSNLGSNYVFQIEAAGGFNLISGHADDAGADWLGTATTIDDNTWHHIMLSIKYPNASIYIDGVLDSVDNMTEPIVNTKTGADYTNSFFNRYNNAAADYEGLLDDWRIYNRALTAAQIKALPGLAPDTTTGLIAHWKLDETSGTTVTDSAGINDGTLMAGLDAGNDSVPGKIGTAIEFDDAVTQDYIDVDMDWDNTLSTFTYAVWLKPNSLAANQNLFYRLNGQSLYPRARLWTSGDADFQLSIASTTYSSTQDTNLVTDVWQHLAFTFDNGAGNILKTYVNGAQVDTTDFTDGTINGGTNNLLIGRDNDLNYYFDGAMDDIRVYDRVLSAPDLEALAGCVGPLAIEGEIIYNSASHIPQYCKDNAWMPMARVPGLGGAGCSNPTGAESEMIYNAGANNVMQYCDGTDWRAIGKSTGAPPAPPVSVARVQSKISLSANPSNVVLDSAPIQGNLLVAIGTHRSDAGDNSISGTGWTQHVYFNALSGNSSNRRGLSIWSKIAGAAEPTSITVDLSNAANSRVLVQEFNITGGTIAFDVKAETQGGTTDVTTISSGTTAAAASSDSLVITGMVTRDGPGTPVWDNGVGNTLGDTSSGLGIYTGYSYDTVGGTKESTASWATARDASAAIAVFAITPTP